MDRTAMKPEDIRYPVHVNRDCEGMITAYQVLDTDRQLVAYTYNAETANHIADCLNQRHQLTVNAAAYLESLRHPPRRHNKTGTSGFFRPVGEE
jgi:hypothetical protein